MKPITRNLLFGAVTVALVLVLLEVVLWVAGVRTLASEQDPFAGFSDRVRVFELDGDRHVYRTPPRAVRHSFNYQEFAADPPTDGIRVFVIGGSSAYGFPWGAEQAFPRALERALEVDRAPDQVEVINAAAMSYGSHRLRILANELVEYRPDLLVVYGGHNEFVERRFYRDHLDRFETLDGVRLWLSHWRLYSALSRLLKPAPAAPTGDESPDDLFGLDVQRQYDPVTAGEEREQVRDRFEENLRAIVELAGEHDVPVVLCTVPSNVADWAPNRSQDDRVGPVAASLLEQVRPAVEAGRADDVIRTLEAEPSSSEHAAIQFALGQAYSAAGRPDEAAAAFRRARDLDTQPSRATSALNDVIRQVAADTPAILVDVERAFDDLSDGAPGFDLFEDYVHPKPAAHRRIALLIWRALGEHGLGGVDPETDEAVFWQAQGDADEAPQSANTPALLFNLGVVLENQGRFDLAIEKYRACLALEPDYVVARVNIARILASRGEAAQAVREYGAVVERRPDLHNAWLGLGEALRATGDLAGAERAFRRLIEMEPRSEAGWNNLGVTLLQQRRLEEAETAFTRLLELRDDLVDARANLGLAQLLGGRIDAAEATFRRCLEQRPDHRAGRNGLAAVLMERGDLDEAERLFRESLRSDPADSFARDGLTELHRRHP